MLIESFQSNEKAGELPCVSVVVPTFNQQDWIVECLMGIINQTTDRTLEILVGDDGSTDETVPRAKQLLMESGLNFRIYQWSRQENHIINGKPTVLNNCRRLFTLAKGKYIAYCEGDDVWLRSDKLALQLQALESSENVQIVWSNVVRGPNLDQVVSSGYGYRELTQQDFQWSNPCGDAACTALWRNTIQGDYIEFLDPVLNTVPYWDWPHYLTILNRKDFTGIRLSEETSFYRVHSKGNYSGLDVMERFIERVQSLNAFQLAFKSLDYHGLREMLDAEKRSVELDVIYRKFPNFLRSRNPLISFSYTFIRLFRYLFRLH
jgi:glycosyltransferase involved in cell wall biosynthesis